MAHLFGHIRSTWAIMSLLNPLAVRRLSIRRQNYPQRHTESRNRGGRSGRIFKPRFNPDIGIRNTLEAMKEDLTDLDMRMLNREVDEDEDIFEEDYDQHIQESHQVYEQNQEYEEAGRRRTIKKIIKRKHFKAEPEPKLISWAGREQIRYLHEMDPDEWTPEKLAESFPISVQGVKKLLKSKVQIYSAAQRIKHDKTVLDNWKQLRLGQGPLSVAVNTREHFLTSGFENMDGVIGLPMPNNNWRNKQETVAGPLPSEESPGEFELMVLKLPEKDKTKPDIGLIEDKPSTQELFDESLGTVGKRASSKPISFEEFKQNLRDDLLERTKHVPKMQVQVKMWLNESDKTDKASFASQECEAPRSDPEDRILEYFECKVHKFRDDDDPVNVKWDTPRRGARHEAYIYEGKTGYQHPYGRSTESYERIEIPKDKLAFGKVYRKNDCYYDEDGEFLYRLPFQIDEDEQPTKP